MKFINNIGFILLSIYLIILGVSGVVPGFAIPSIITSVLAIAAGIFILLGR